MMQMITMMGQFAEPSRNLFKYKILIKVRWANCCASTQLVKFQSFIKSALGQNAEQ